MVLETLSLASFYPLLELIINNHDSENVNFLKIFYLNILEHLKIEKNYYLTFTISIVGGLFVSKILILLFCNWHNANFQFAIRFFLTKKLYKIYLHKDYQSLMKFSSADIVKNIDHEINIFASGVSGLMTILTEGIIFIGILIFLLYFNFKATLLLTIFLIIIVVLLQLSYNKTIVNWGKESQHFNKLRIQNFIESFNAIKEIKIFGKENLFYNLMDKFNDNFFNINRKEVFLQNIPRTLLELILILIVSVYLIYFSSNNFDFKAQFANIGVYFIAAYRIFPSANRIIVSLQRLKFAKVYIENIALQIVNTKKEISYKINVKSEAIDLNKNFELKNCSFSYESSKNKILDDLNIKFETGKIYGIKGSSGTGKTTLLNVICGLIQPSNGSIIIDGKKITTDLIKFYQKNISYVPQNTFLFDTSILKNITLEIDQKTKPNEKIVQNLIERLLLKEKVLSLKQGLSTNVGERGINLSGGQIQRIGLARALYHDPKILVLDEATNAIETEMEKEVLNYLETIKKNKIIILVAHRESAFKNCDSIFKLENGKLLNIK